MKNALNFSHIGGETGLERGDSRVELKFDVETKSVENFEVNIEGSVRHMVFDDLPAALGSCDCRLQTILHGPRINILVPVTSFHGLIRALTLLILPVIKRVLIH